MARKAKSSDISYNARRREYRAAQRYLRIANENTGVVAEKNRALARTHLLNALETYDPTAPAQKISSQIINTAAALGIDVQVQRSEFIMTITTQMTPKQRKNLLERQARAIERSTQALESARDDAETRAALEANEIMSNPIIGKRIMGGLVDVWKDKVSKGKSAAENRRDAQKAIFTYFGASSWVDVLQKLEQAVGSELYAIANELEMYDVIKLSIQKGVTGNTLVA